MSSSDISSLSSAPSTDDELVLNPVRGDTLDKYFKNGSKAAVKEVSPPPKKKRPASPPHEYVLADNPNIAFIVMFRSRFSDAFAKSLPHYGPQDIERGVADPLPGEHVERLLCALLGVVLNRKKDVEYLTPRGHFGRALEEAVQTHSNQWPSGWQGKNPLHGGGNFSKMSPEERLTLLKALIIWSLGSSEAVQAILKESYKQQRHDDDLNQPLSVQVWGRDGDKRRYWLVEGQDDTHFRLYRESNPALKHNTWRSVAGTIDELKSVADRLGEDGTQASRRLQERITLGIPRFEASEEKRKRRDYRNARKAQFVRPEPGFSLYEGRTRGKRIRYTYSDEEEGGSDAPSTRRSNRQSGISTPAEPAGPTYTASGRQVRSRIGGTYGETMLSGQHVEGHVATVGGADGADDGAEQPIPTGRPRRTALHNESNGRPRARTHIEGYNALDEMEDESDATTSGGEWDGGDDDEVDEKVVDDDEDDDADMSEDGADEEEDDFGNKQSLVVSLRYHKKLSTPSKDATEDIGDSITVHCVAESTVPSDNNSSPGVAYPDSQTKKLMNGNESSLGHPTSLHASSNTPTSKMAIPATSHASSTNDLPYQLPNGSATTVVVVDPANSHQVLANKSEQIHGTP